MLLEADECYAMCVYVFTCRSRGRIYDIESDQWKTRLASSTEGKESFCKENVFVLYALGSF